MDDVCSFFFVAFGPFGCLFVVGGSSSCVFFRMDFGYVFGSV